MLEVVTLAFFLNIKKTIHWKMLSNFAYIRILQLQTCKRIFMSLSQYLINGQHAADLCVTFQILTIVFYISNFEYFNVCTSWHTCTMYLPSISFLSRARTLFSILLVKCTCDRSCFAISFLGSLGIFTLATRVFSLFDFFRLSS